MAGKKRFDLLRGLLEQFTPGVKNVKKGNKSVENQGEVAGLSDIDKEGVDATKGSNNSDAVSKMIKARRKARAEKNAKSK